MYSINNLFCDLDYLDWNTFYNNYWNLNDTDNGLLIQFNKNVYTNSNVFKNRRCWEYDYFSLYSKYKDQPNLYCNILGYENKPRTYEDTPNSLFPMQTRTRTEVLSQAQTALVMGIFIMQLSHLLTVKTRQSSLFQQGMLNEFMNYGLIYQIFLISFIIYIPFMNQLIGSRPLRFIFWTPAMPFCIVILFLHEFRKGIVRKDKTKSNFITRNTYW